MAREVLAAILLQQPFHGATADALPRPHQEDESRGAATVPFSMLEER
jgi:hypothetical protein